MTKPMIDRTFVRVGGESLSVRQMAHRDFADWVNEWYARRGLRYRQHQATTTAEQREEVLAQMVRNGCPPAMLRDVSVPPA